MRLIRILDQITQIEKISFLKILDGICSDLGKPNPRVNKILNEGDGQIKKVDDENIGDLFHLISEQYKSCLNEKIKFSDNQLDVFVDILVRDGNSMMSREWFLKLYKDELAKLKANIKRFSSQLLQDNNNLSPERKRDYLIYQECVKTAFENDLLRNREENLSWEEKSVLQTLARGLELSNEEIRWITYSIIPAKQIDINDIITILKDSGVIFYNRKTSTIYVADEIVWIIREIINIEIPNKYLRRVLRNLTNPEINIIAYKHNIERKLSREGKIQAIMAHGVSVTDLLISGMHKVDTPKSSRAVRIHNLMVKNLEIKLPAYGRSLEDKVSNLIQYFNAMEKDELSPLPRDGYDRLLTDISSKYRKLNTLIKKEFQLQPEKVLNPELLDDHLIKPKDILYLFSNDELRNFCKVKGISSRGNLVSNIIKKYTSIEDLYIENYELVGRRDLKALRERGLTVKESEFGLLYEKFTKVIFKQLGFDVDEGLRKSVNTQRHQMDVVLNLGKSEIIIIECKSKKGAAYRQYTSVARQLKSYQNLCQNKGLHVTQVIVIADDFSDEFVTECEYDYEINLSLITSAGLKTILKGLKDSKHTELPVRLLLKDGLLNADRIVSVLNN